MNFHVTLYQINAPGITYFTFKPFCYTNGVIVAKFKIRVHGWKVARALQESADRALFTDVSIIDEQLKRNCKNSFELW